MKDAYIAKQILLENDFTLVVVKDGELIFQSKDKGIKPIYELAINMREKVKGASLADRVIGRGAAILCGYMEIKELYADLISKSGIIELNNNDIVYETNNLCDYIMNRDRTDYCPIEKLSLEIDSPLELIREIDIFFKMMNENKI